MVPEYHRYPRYDQTNHEQYENKHIATNTTDQCYYRYSGNTYSGNYSNYSNKGGNIKTIIAILVVMASFLILFHAIFMLGFERGFNSR